MIPGKIPLRIHPLFIALIFFIGWINTHSIALTLVWAVVIFVSVLVHELGHALSAIQFGQRAEIELFGLGGVTYRTGRPLKLWQDFLVVLSGPLAGFALFFLAFQIRSLLFERIQGTLFVYSLEVTILVNLFWTLVNLFPVHPLDGGHLMRIVLEGLMGYRGVKFSFFISILLAFASSLFFFIAGEFLAGALFFIFAFESFRGWKNALALSEEDRDDTFQKYFKEAEQAYQEGNTEVAFEMFEKLRRGGHRGVLHQASTLYSARILAERGHYKEGYELLSPLQGKLDPEALRLFHQLSYRQGNWEEAIQLGNRVYQYEPNYQTALINSLCHAILGETQPAIGWLRTAINDGLPNVSEILHKREFDHIRNDPAFQALDPKKGIPK